MAGFEELVGGRSAAGNRGPVVASYSVMDRNRPNAQTRQNGELAALRGEVHALQGVIAVLIAHLALLGRDPHARREEILRSLESMLPHALAQIEHDAPPVAAAGFERAVEMVTHLARTAVRFEPLKQAGQGPAPAQTPRQPPDPGA
ncbi:MAG: hypothetical protein ICV73_05925 [Acetobacteraceae bacterium]|nr:hypothetical protein [Acetobacteraceae bacterium]